MEPQVRFCTTSDGVRIAYATMGKGHPYITVPVWLSSLKYEAYEPRVASIHQQMAANRQHVQYDRRGTGMSDRDVRDFTRGALVKDLEAVIDHLKLRRVVLWASDIAGPVAIEYAFRHPAMVSHLILHGCFARGQDVSTKDQIETLIRLIRGGWEIGSELIPVLIMPGADPETARRYFTALRESCSADAAARQLEAALAEDVTDLLPQIKTPTLVLHARNDRAIPFELGRRLASLMPNARLVPLDQDVHWDIRNAAPVLQAVNDFLAPRQRAKPKTGKPAAPSGLVTVMFTDMEGSTTLTQRLGDARAREVLRQHERIVREALRAHGGAEVKTMGDGFMASFSSATRALECAIAMQRAFEERNPSLSAHPEALEGRAEPQPSAHGSLRQAQGRLGSPRADRDAGASLEPLHVRIGLNAGEPIAEEDPDGRSDLYGTAVNLAARIAAEAEAGTILASDVVRQLVAGKDFLFADRGEANLKGFDEPVRLYEVRWRPPSTELRTGFDSPASAVGSG